MDDSASRRDSHVLLHESAGNSVGTADSAGNILTSADYRPYGGQALGAPQDGLGYTGHVNDADSGLVYMQVRYYDPEVGRFLSVDSGPASPTNVFAFNRFAYANDIRLQISIQTAKTARPPMERHAA